MFNKISTWELLEAYFGEIAWACDHPTNGTLTHSGLHASAISKTRTGNTCFWQKSVTVPNDPEAAGL